MISYCDLDLGPIVSRAATFPCIPETEISVDVISAKQKRAQDLVFLVRDTCLKFFFKVN